jgi:hypothetical protein
MASSRDPFDFTYTLLCTEWDTQSEIPLIRINLHKDMCWTGVENKATMLCLSPISKSGGVLSMFKFQAMSDRRSLARNISPVGPCSVVSSETPSRV